MGRHTEDVNLETRALDMIGRTYDGIRVLEMGAMEHKTPEPRMPAREWYLAHGARKVDSIDLNGKWGAIRHDLDQPIPESLHERYHLVTNYGTSEHVNNQYMFFRNMHDACHTGGIMVHELLHDGVAPGHGRYYYTTKTVFALARLCSYAVLTFDNMNSAKADHWRKDNLLVAFLKRRDSHFPDRSWRFLQRAAIIDTGDIRRTGDYNAAGHGAMDASPDR